MNGRDDEVGVHRCRLVELCAVGGPLTAAGAGATTNNPEWFTRVGGRLRPRAGRRELHVRLVEEAETRQGEVGQRRRALVLAGPPGAGKSSVVATVLGQLGSDPHRWRTINSDDFKDALLEQALADGSYRSWLLQGLDQGGDAGQLQPRELASLVHEESGILARAARQRAMDRGEDLVVDGTLSQETAARGLIAELTEAGYEVRLVGVEATREVVGARIDARWQAGRAAALSGGGDEREARLGGRWVPPSFVDSLYPQGRADRSVCAEVVQVLAEQVPLRQVDTYSVAAVDAGPVHERRLAIGPPRAFPGRSGYPVPPTPERPVRRYGPGPPGRGRGEDLGRG